MAPSRLVAFLFVAGIGGCGGSPSGDDDAATGDAATADASAAAAGPDGSPPDAPAEPTRWTATIVAPPRGAVVLLPLGMDFVTGAVSGYTGPEAWGPQSSPVRVSASGEVEVLAVPEANYGFAWGAGETSTAGEHAWQPSLWTGDERMPLPVPLGFGSGSAHAVNAAGLVVGSFADYDDPLPPEPIGPRPCVWIDGDVAPLATFDGDPATGAAWAVSADGVIAGSLSTPGAIVAVRWPSAAAQPVAVEPIDGAYLAEARAINGAGDVAGRASLEGETRAFVDRADAGGTTLLPFLAGGASYAEAFDLDEVGHVVGTANAGDGVAHAVLWRDGAIVDLNDVVVGLPGTVRYLSSAVGIDQQRRIAAEAVMEEGFGDSVRYLAILEPVAPR
jgi:probable HAF family extracellular repeat protein